MQIKLSFPYWVSWWLLNDWTGPLVNTAKRAEEKQTWQCLSPGILHQTGFREEFFQRSESKCWFMLHFVFEGHHRPHGASISISVPINSYVSLPILLVLFGSKKSSRSDKFQEVEHIEIVICFKRTHRGMASVKMSLHHCQSMSRCTLLTLDFQSSAPKEILYFLLNYMYLTALLTTLHIKILYTYLWQSYKIWFLYMSWLD